MYRHNGLLFSDNGAANLLVDDPPQNAEKHQGWARDAFGYGYIKFAPQPVAYTYQGRTYTRDGALIVTGATPGARNDYADGYGALCRADGALYIGNPSGNRKNQGWLINPNGSAAIDGFGFFLGLGDKGSGEVNLVPEFGTGSATFTRATTATTINSAGLIVSVASGVPRSWYWPDTLVYGGYLPEPARTNLALQSILPGGGAAPTGWTQPSATGTSAPVASIYGDGDGAVAYAQSASAERPYLSQTVSVSDGVTYCFSTFVEESSGLGANQHIGVAGGTATPTVSFQVCPANPAGTNVGAVGVGRLFVTFTVAAAGTVQIRFGLGVVSNATGSTTQSRPQLEAGTYPTTHIPTATASVTRNADVLTYPFTGNADATQGTWYAEFGVPNATSGQRVIGANDGLSTNNRTFDVFANSTTQLRVFGNTAGVGQYQVDINGLSSTANKCAGVYAANYANAALNGVLGTADTSVTLPASPAVIEIGQLFNTSQLSGPIKNVAIYRKQLADAQLQDMT